MSRLRAARAWFRRNADRWLLALAALLLAAGLLHPHLTITRSLFEHVIVLDVTQSMGVTDEKVDGKPVSRLAYAKQALRRSLLQLPCGSKVGWAVFTEYRALLLLAPIEVCANLDELRSTLARIDSRMAWAGNSEIAKGLHSALGIARQLPDRPSLVFITDGQEAPPLDPRFRRPLDDKPAAVPGLMVGVGDLIPSPIPKVDPEGRPLGFWRADEVMQTDPRIEGRGVGAPLTGAAPTAAALGRGMPGGGEHLSSMHEGYLRSLAHEAGITFLRLESAGSLAQALMAPALARPSPVRTDAQPMLAMLAFGLLLLRRLQSFVESGWDRTRVGHMIGQRPGTDANRRAVGAATERGRHLPSSSARHESGSREATVRDPQQTQ